MSIETVKRVCERFLQQEECQVFAIKGAWGAGKTCAGKTLIDRTPCRSLAYAYVSFFGVPSLADLRLAIVANGRSTEHTVPNSRRSWFASGKTRARHRWPPAKPSMRGTGVPTMIMSIWSSTASIL